MPPAPLIRFGLFELDTQARKLYKQGRVVRVQDQPLLVLELLLEKSGQVVTREELQRRLWPGDVYVDFELGLTGAIKRLRQALDDSAASPRFVATAPKSGYRFIAPVELVVNSKELEEQGGTNRGVPGSRLASLEGSTRGQPGQELPADSQAAPRDLAPAPARRRWTVWLSVATVVAVLASVFFVRSHLIRAGKTAPSRVMLAVLPFVNLSGDPAEEYFADGMTEEMITRIGSLDPEGLGVIARTSAMQYKGARKNAAEIGKELGVNYLLEGSTRRDGDRVRVTAQLIRASDQTHVWAGNFDENRRDLFRLQSDIAIAISDKIQLTLAKRVREKLAAPQPVNPEAHQAYLLGLQAWEQRSRESAQRAVTEFQRAIDLDPRYAPPYAQLAMLYALASVVDLGTTLEFMPKANSAALRAITLDDSLAKGHTALAFVKAHYDYDWLGAESEFRRGLALNPNDAAAHFFYSNSFLSPRGRHDEALAEMGKALDLDPLSPALRAFAGQTFVWAGRLDDALAAHQKCAELFPQLAINYERMAHVYAYMARYDEAISAEKRARVLSGEASDMADQKEQSLRKALREQGPRGYWKKQLEFATAPGSPPETYRDPFDLAIVYAQLDDRENAIRSLQEGYDSHALSMSQINVEPAFNSLHSDPRFQELVRRIGLAP